MNSEFHADNSSPKPRKRTARAKGPRTWYRKVDSLGRVTLPSKIRNTLDLQAGDELRFYTTDQDEVVLTRDGPTCAFCGTPFQIVQVRGVSLCTDCFESLKEFAASDPLPESEND